MVSYRRHQWPSMSPCQCGELASLVQRVHVVVVLRLGAATVPGVCILLHILHRSTALSSRWPSPHHPCGVGGRRRRRGIVPNVVGETARRRMVLDPIPVCRRRFSAAIRIIQSNAKSGQKSRYRHYSQVDFALLLRAQLRSWHEYLLLHTDGNICASGVPDGRGPRGHAC